MNQRMKSVDCTFETGEAAAPARLRAPWAKPQVARLSAGKAETNVTNIGGDSNNKLS